jgi:hypothetical protein
LIKYYPKPRLQPCDCRCCGGIESEQSRAAAGSAGTRAVYKIGRVFRLRPASRSAEHMGRPALSPLALSARELRSLYSKARDRREPAAIVIAPPWPNTGSLNAFAAQAASHKTLVMKFCLCLDHLMYLPKDNRKLATWKSRCIMTVYRASYTIGLLIPCSHIEADHLWTGF